MSLVISIPRRSLVVLIGLPGSGKSTFARKHFWESSIVSSDACRRLVSDDESNQYAGPYAFAVMEAVVVARMRLGRLCVIDATNLKQSARKAWLDLARRHGYPAYAIVLDVSPAICIERDRARGRRVGTEVIIENTRRMKSALADLVTEGFVHAWRLGQDVIDDVRIDVQAREA